MESVIGEWWQDTVRIRVLAVGTVTLGARWRYKYERLTNRRFYANQGDGAFLRFPKTGDFPLQSGVPYLIPPGVGFETFSSPGVEHFYAHFDVLGVPEFAIKRMFSMPVALSSATLRSMVADIAPRLRQEEVNVTLQWRIKAIAFEALALSLQSLPPEQLQNGVEALHHVAPVLPALRHIQDRFAQTLSNEMLAQLCGMSEDYFIRRFRECVGQTPSQYTLHYRLNMAMQRLQFTQDSVEQIAYETGFCHRSHLTNALRTHSHLTPIQYRSQTRLMNGASDPEPSD